MLHHRVIDVVYQHPFLHESMRFETDPVNKLPKAEYANMDIHIW